MVPVKVGKKIDFKFDEGTFLDDNELTFEIDEVKRNGKSFKNNLPIWLVFIPEMRSF